MVGYRTFAPLALILVVIVGIARGAPASAPAAAEADALQQIVADYQLGVGDKIKLGVFGEPDLSGEFAVDSTGSLALPLIGSINAVGRTIRQVQEAVVARLKEGYLRDPSVSIEVLNYRPFSIIGEVIKGGEYPYQPGMTILNAVAVAGGYSYRANTSEVEITRGGRSFMVGLRTGTTYIRPGDIVKVRERFF